MWAGPSVSRMSSRVCFSVACTLTAPAAVCIAPGRKTIVSRPGTRRPTSNNTTNKALKNLSYLLHCMDLCNQRLLRWQDTIDETTVASGFIEKLGQPTVPEKGQRVAGIRLDSRRLTWVMAAVLQFAHVITGFRSRELRTYLQNRFGLSPDEYTAAQLRYDLVKLRAKGWITKLKKTTHYVLENPGGAGEKRHEKQKEKNQQ